jgi:hypothetical protein
MIYKENLWDMKELYQVPHIYATNLFAVENMKSFFYEGLIYI